MFILVIIHMNRNFGQSDSSVLLCISFLFIMFQLGIPIYSVLLKLPLLFTLYICVIINIIESWEGLAFTYGTIWIKQQLKILVWKLLDFFFLLDRKIAYC